MNIAKNIPAIAQGLNRLMNHINIVAIATNMVAINTAHVIATNLILFILVIS